MGDLPLLYVFIYLFPYGIMYIYFILWVIIQYNSVCLCCSNCSNFRSSFTLTPLSICRALIFCFFFQHFLTFWCHKTLTFHSPGSALGPLLQGIPVPFSTELYLFLWHCDSLTCALIPTFPTMRSPLLFSSNKDTLTMSFRNSVGPGHNNGDMAVQCSRKSTEPRAERYFE